MFYTSSKVQPIEQYSVSSESNPALVERCPFPELLKIHSFSPKVIGIFEGSSFPLTPLPLLEELDEFEELDEKELEFKLLLWLFKCNSEDPYGLSCARTGSL